MMHNTTHCSTRLLMHTNTVSLTRITGDQYAHYCCCIPAEGEGWERWARTWQQTLLLLLRKGWQKRQMARSAVRGSECSATSTVSVSGPDCDGKAQLLGQHSCWLSQWKMPVGENTLLATERDVTCRASHLGRSHGLRERECANVPLPSKIDWPGG